MREGVGINHQSGVDPHTRSRGMVTFVALGLAAGAGYWWGSVKRDVSASEEISAVRRGMERPVVSKAPILEPADFVREAVKGSLDERQHWGYVSTLNEDEVKAAIAELGNTWEYPVSSTGLPGMLFYRWAELDPVAANDATKIMHPKGFSHIRQSVVAAWINQGGGSAAWDAVRGESGMWDCTRSVPGEVAQMLAASLSGLDDAKAFREAARLNDDNSEVADILCHARAGRALATPESRAAFLAAAATHPEPYVVGCARETLFREWAKKDIEAARAGAMALPVSEEERANLLSWINTEERNR